MLLEASQYTATDEYTTFSEKVKQVCVVGGWSIGCLVGSVDGVLGAWWVRWLVGWVAGGLCSLICIRWFILPSHQLLHLGCSRASKLHQAFFSAVQKNWCPVMCDGFLVITHEMGQRSLSLSTSSQEQPA